METKSTAQIVESTLATLERARQSPTTEKQASGNSNVNEQGWIKSNLKMKLEHPQLRLMAHEIFLLACDIYKGSRAGKLVVLYGPNGCGKTMAARMMHRWFMRVYADLPYFNCPSPNPDEQPHSIPGSEFRNWAVVVDGFKQNEWEAIHWLCYQCFVIIDDIGAEHDPSGIGREKLYVILNRREKMRTVITTNVLPKDWPSKFENRIASRLFRNAVHIDLSQVPDYNA